MNSKRFKQAITGVALAAMTTGAIAALPYDRPRTTVKHIESYGTYAIVHLSRDVDNIWGCTGPDLDTPEDLRSFYLDFSTPDGKANYVLVMAAATARKRTGFQVSSCDSNNQFPAIDAVEVSF